MGLYCGIPMIFEKIKWIIGYIDSYDAVHFKVIHKKDAFDTHWLVWGGEARHSKWRWNPNFPKHLNKYNEEIDENLEDKIWQIIEKYV